MRLPALRLLASTVIASVASACASVTPTLTASGEPLEARTHKVRVAAELKDNGDFIPAHDVVVFDGHLQGPAFIDELDFFHIAGDTEAVARIVKWREQDNMAILVGAPVATLGVASFAVAGGLYAVRLQSGESEIGFGDTPEGQLTVGLGFAGAILMGGGAGLYYLLAPAPLHSEASDFIEPRARAIAAAEAYNAGLTSSSP